MNVQACTCTNFNKVYLYLCLEKLKELIQTETQIPKDKQNLCGWISKQDKTVGDQVCIEWVFK